MGAFQIPRFLLDKFEMMMRTFLWQGTFESRKPHLVAWDMVCSAKEQGGLGIRNLRQMNDAMLGKLVWCIYEEDQSLWSRALRSKYLDSFDKERIFTVENAPYGSMIWNGLRRVRLKIVKFLQWKPSIGNKIDFWQDSWLLTHPLSSCGALQNLKLLLTSRWGNKLESY